MPQTRLLAQRQKLSQTVFNSGAGEPLARKHIGTTTQVRTMTNFCDVTGLWPVL